MAPSLYSNARVSMKLEINHLPQDRDVVGPGRRPQKEDGRGDRKKDGDNRNGQDNENGKSPNGFPFFGGPGPKTAESSMPHVGTSPAATSQAVDVSNSITDSTSVALADTPAPASLSSSLPPDSGVSTSTPILSAIYTGFQSTATSDPSSTTYLSATTTALTSPTTVPQVSPIPEPSSSSAGSAPNTSTAIARKTTPAGAIAGGIIGGLLLFALIAAAILYIVRRRRRTHIAPSAEFMGPRGAGSPAPPAFHRLQSPTPPTELLAAGNFGYISQEKDPRFVAG